MYRYLFLTLAIFSAWFIFPAAAVSAQDTQPVVYILEIEGSVNQGMVSYFERGIAEAEQNGAEALVIALNTPGGVVGDTIEIIQLFRNASIPIIVYVSPSGGQAASAGSLITLAAHASGMAPETIIGAASPINGDGSDIGETLYRKQVEDLQATVRAIAEGRPEEAVTLGESMISDAEAVTANEAAAVGFVDVVAADVDDLLQQLDGHEVVVNGEPRLLNTAAAVQVPLEATMIERIFYALSDLLLTPFVLGALIAIGIKALSFEFSNPGFGVSGVVGLMCIALAIYGLGFLPVNWIGLILVLVAYGLFIIEAFTPTFGILSLSGVITMMIGLLVLFNSPGSTEFSRISIPGALLLTAASGGIFIFVMTKAIAAQRAAPYSGSDSMVGRIGRARKNFREDGVAYSGSVFVYGALWQAESDEPIEKGEKVAIKAIDGLTLRVKRLT